MATDNEEVSCNEGEPIAAELETLQSIPRNVTRHKNSSLLI